MVVFLFLFAVRQAGMHRTIGRFRALRHEGAAEKEIGLARVADRPFAIVASQLRHLARATDRDIARLAALAQGLGRRPDGDLAIGDRARRWRSRLDFQDVTLCPQAVDFPHDRVAADMQLSADFGGGLGRPKHGEQIDIVRRPIRHLRFPVIFWFPFVVCGGFLPLALFLSPSFHKMLLGRFFRLPK
jgi:hypothetical protein